MGTSEACGSSREFETTRNRLKKFCSRYPKKKCQKQNFLCLNYGDCSLVAECTVVVREARVRFSAFTLKEVTK